MHRTPARPSAAVSLMILFSLIAVPFLTAQEERQDATARLVSVEEIIGYQIVDEQGEILGDLQDLAVTSDGSVPYLMVRFTPFLFDYEFRQQLHLVPFDRAEVDRQQDRIVITRVDAEQLAGGPPVDQEELLRRDWDVAFREWWYEVPRYDGDVAVEPGPGAGEQDVRQLAEQAETGEAVLASILIGFDILDTAGEDIGDVDGAMLNLQSGRIEYLGLGHAAGFLGLGGQIYPVPTDRLTIDIEEQTAGGSVRLEVVEPTLEEAPGFDDAEAWAQAPAPEWTDRVQDFWSGR